MSAPSRFLILGEPLALDLVNTRICRDGREADLLDEPAALAEWLHAENSRVSWVGTVTATDLAEIRALRDAIDELLCASRAARQPQAAALNKVNAALAKPEAQPQLAWTATAPYRIAPPAGSQRAALLHRLAVDALDVLTGPQAQRLRQCAHPDCRLQFIARNPRRRWCSGALCGNRARVARHYRRQAKSTS